MSAPLKLTAYEVTQLGEAMEKLTDITRRHGVELDPYGQFQVRVGDSTLRVSWDAEARAYVIDDKNGD